jgi:hypothetical protein
MAIDMGIDLSQIESRDAGMPGQITDVSAPHIVNSFHNTGTSAIEFGYAVARGATEGTCKLVSADSDKIIGIATKEVWTDPTTLGSNNVNYGINDMVPVFRWGAAIFATAAENTTAGDGVIVITASGTLGSTTGGAAGTGRVALARAVWETTTTAGGIGKITIL